MNLTQIIADVKRDLLFHVIQNMKHKNLDMRDARYLAQDVMSIFPVFTIDELLEKLSKLSSIYKEARAVYIKYANLYFETKRQYLLTVVPPSIHRGEIDQALSLLKGGDNHG